MGQQRTTGFWFVDNVATTLEVVRSLHYIYHWANVYGIVLVLNRLKSYFVVY